ncbi:hypothetical protein NUM_73030 [Actinocatenispora comari]|uniref:Uncharacterized protein n=1 Tax=Actinocatenispora comari TaxID=2807577 RepID=A0A8J4ESL0_9ACTN|nr:hypothetical protein NUM_73030 [Actinocatenispora comari]
MPAAVGVDPLGRAEPVPDRVLWNYAQRVLGDHQADPGTGRCRFCGDSSPCAAARIAARAAEVSRVTAPAVYTARAGRAYRRPDAGRRPSPVPRAEGPSWR